MELAAHGLAVLLVRAQQVKEDLPGPGPLVRFRSLQFLLDGGQGGDSILVQAPKGRAMLVDAGESWTATTIPAALAAERIARLEYVVATHDHADQIGGMTGVLPSVRVGTFVSNGVPASTQAAIDLCMYLSARGIATDAATAGDTLALDPANVPVTVLSPPAPGKG